MVSLKGGGGCDGAIHSAAGPRLLAACVELSPDPDTGHRCNVGDSVLTRGPFGPNLASENVVHCVGPDFRRGLSGDLCTLSSPMEGNQLLLTAFTSSLRTCSEARFTSVAIPAVSCGIYGARTSDAAAILVQAIVHQASCFNNGIHTIVVVLDEEMIGPFTTAFCASPWILIGSSDGSSDDDVGGKKLH